MRQKRVFNNIIRATELKEDLTQVFEELVDILGDHAGPFAASCVIGSRWRQVNDIDEFTKDGIQILAHLIVSEDATTRFATRMARFIGFSVDKRCHDGTTTSMLLFCELAIMAIAKIDMDLDEPERYRWWKNVEKILSACRDYVDHLKITEADIVQRAADFGIYVKPEDVRAAMAYHMAMISSKGDHDLATKVSEVIRAAPKTVYGMFKNLPTLLESDTRYTIRRQDYDIMFDAALGHHGYWNYKNDTQFLAEDCVVFATGNEIVVNSLEASFLRAFISTNPSERANLSQFGVTQGWEDFHQGKKTLIILSKMLQEPHLFADIVEFNRENPNVKIVHFNVQYLSNRIRTSTSKAFHYMAGKHRFDEVNHSNALDSFIGLDRDGVRVHAIGSHVKVSGIYDKTGGVFHPYYDDPEAFEPYTNFRLELEDLISVAKENITNNALDPDEVTYLTNLYRSMTCQEIFDIEIGGLAHDQKANRTVYEDAMGAALSAVNDGVVLGGYGHLANLLATSDLDDGPEHIAPPRKKRSILSSIFGYDNDIEDAELTVSEWTRQCILNVLCDSVRSTTDELDSAVRKLSSKWDYIVASPVEFFRDDHHVSVETFDRTTIERFLRREEGTPVLLQAWAGYHEQFRRFVDILPKLANTTNLVDMRVKDMEDIK